MNAPTAPMVDLALEHAAHGWPVFPCWWPLPDSRCACGKSTCGNVGKHPIGKLAPHGLNDATTDRETIRRWWKAYPLANIGIATGPTARTVFFPKDKTERTCYASGFIVIDIDPDKGGSDALAELERQHGALPDTPEAITGSRGRHLLFAHPGGKVKTTGSIAPGIDVRGDGGYIIAPGSLHKTGNRYAWDTALHPDELAPAELPYWLLSLVLDTAPPPATTNGTTDHKPRLDIPAILAGVPEGMREKTIWQLACSYRGANTPREVAERLILEAASNCTPPFPADEAISKVTRAYKLYSPNAAQKRQYDAEPPVAPVPPGPVPPGVIPHASGVQGAPRRPYTDLGNAERLADQHGQDLRFSKHLGWLVWDGRRWKIDETGEVQRRAALTVRSIYIEAAKEPDDRERAAIANHAKKSESARSLAAMVSLAENLKNVATHIRKFDTDPWVINASNGTIDLKTGILRSHRREDHITRLAPVTYDPDARLDMWDNFLQAITAGDTAFQRFLQVSVGYSLTGVTDEEKLFMPLGIEDTGKSTFLEAIKAMFGDYAATANFETFVARRDTGSTRNDIARLAGARIVVSIEVDEGKRLAEGLVKTITGGDTVTARFLYKDEFEFLPQFKLWLAANHAPQVKQEDGAMWKRILRLPFEHQVAKEKKDPRVKATLRDVSAAGPAILAWAVEGCLIWQREGLGVPPAVEKATKAYRADMDPLKEFLADCCVLDNNASMPTTELQEEYAKWCKLTGTRQLSPKILGEKLRTRGCEPIKRCGKREWLGIRLPTDNEPSNTDLGDSLDGMDGTGVDSDNFSHAQPHDGKLPNVPSVPSVPSTNGLGTDDLASVSAPSANGHAPKSSLGSIGIGKIDPSRLQELLDQGVSKDKARELARVDELASTTRVQGDSTADDDEVVM